MDKGSKKGGSVIGKKYFQSKSLLCKNMLIHPKNDIKSMVVPIRFKHLAKCLIQPNEVIGCETCVACYQ